MNKNNITSLDLLQIAFIVLKLCHVIDWPWICVLLPIIVSFGFVIIVACMKVKNQRKKAKQYE